MAFTKFNDIVAALGAGNVSKATYQKVLNNVVAGSAIAWHEFFTATGVPGPTPLVDAAGVGTVMTGSAHNGLDVNQLATPSVQHLLGGRVVSLASLGAGYAVLVDLLYTYQSCLIGATPTVLDNSAALTRYTDGVGVMGFCAWQTTQGATLPVLTPNVRWDDDTDSNAVAVNSAVSLNYPRLWYNSAATALPFFYSTTVGKRGIKRINSYTNTLPTTGTVWFGLCKPLAWFPFYGTGTPGARDFVFQLPYLPRIYDGACLGWLVHSATGPPIYSTIVGSLNTAWG